MSSVVGIAFFLFLLLLDGAFLGIIFHLSLLLAQCLQNIEC